MPDTPIDLSEGIQSVRLKVPTAVVPIPPAGFVQLHSPAPGELALRLPDGSVVPIGGGGGGGAASSVLGPGGAIDAANSDPRIGININAAPGTGIAFTGRFLDQFATPLGEQVDHITVSSAELLALDTAPKVLVAAHAARCIVPKGMVLRSRPDLVGSPVAYVDAGLANLFVGYPPYPPYFQVDTPILGVLSTSELRFTHVAPQQFAASGGLLSEIVGQPLILSLSSAITEGNYPVDVTLSYLVVA